MAIAGLVFALFTVGYILGVWTACLVFRQPQRAYEEGTQWRATDGAHWRATDGAHWRATDGAQWRATDGVQWHAANGVNASLSGARVILLASATRLGETRR